MAFNRSTTISVRLSRDELVALRRVNEDTDSARIRALIRESSVAEEIAERTAIAVDDRIAVRINALAEKQEATTDVFKKLISLYRGKH